MGCKGTKLRSIHMLLYWGHNSLHTKLCICRILMRTIHPFRAFTHQVFLSWCAIGWVYRFRHQFWPQFLNQKAETNVISHFICISDICKCTTGWILSGKYICELQSSGCSMRYHIKALCGELCIPLPQRYRGYRDEQSPEVQATQLICQTLT